MQRNASFFSLDRTIGGGTPIPATQSPMSMQETENPTSSSSLRSSGGSIWVFPDESDSGSKLAAGVGAGFGAVLIIFLSVVVYQRKRGRKRYNDAPNQVASTRSERGPISPGTGRVLGASLGDCNQNPSVKAEAQGPIEESKKVNYRRQNWI